MLSEYFIYIFMLYETAIIYAAALVTFRNMQKMKPRTYCELICSLYEKQ